MATAQPDNQSLTREKILAAAHEEFTTRRFVDVSLDAVAARAGFTKGAIYSNFSSKTDLLFSVLERHMDRVVDDYSFEMLLSPATHLPEAIGRLASKSQDSELGYFRLLTAVWAEAVHDAEFAARFAAIRTAHRTRIANFVKQRVASANVELSVDATHLATGLIGMSMASLMDAAIDDQVDAAAVHKAMIDLVLAGVLATAAPADADSSK